MDEQGFPFDKLNTCMTCPSMCKEASDGLGNIGDEDRRFEDAVGRIRFGVCCFDRMQTCNKRPRRFFCLWKLLLTSPIFYITSDFPFFSLSLSLRVRSHLVPRSNPTSKRDSLTSQGDVRWELSGHCLIGFVSICGSCITVWTIKQVKPTSFCQLTRFP